MDSKRMTWQEIKEAYPHQNVGLVERIPNHVNFDTAIVKCTDKDKTYSELLHLAFNGEIDMRYTTMDEDDGLVCQSSLVHLKCLYPKYCT